MSTAHRHQRYRRRRYVNSADRELLFIFGTVLVMLAVIAGILVAVATMPRGFEAPPRNPDFPKPAGYQFQDWRLNEDITFCVDGEGGPINPADLLEAAEEAVGRWQYADAGKLPLRIDGLCPGRGTRNGDGASVIGWETLSKHAGEAQVVTDSFDHVTEADIRIDPHLLGRDCLRPLLLHEVGHVLGAGHQRDDAVTVMRPYLVCGEMLSWADIGAVRYLYH